VYAAVRSEVIKHEPTFMLGVLSGLVWPQIRVEIEVTAVRPARGLFPLPAGGRTGRAGLVTRSG
jgi:hypothetical protein